MASRKRMDAPIVTDPKASKLAVGTWLVRPRPTNRCFHAQIGHLDLNKTIQTWGAMLTQSWAKNAPRKPIQAQHEEVVECKGLRLGVPLALGSVVRSAANFLFNLGLVVKPPAQHTQCIPATSKHVHSGEILLGQPTKLEKLPLGTPQEGAIGHLFMVRHPWSPWHPWLADVPHVISSIHRGKSTHPIGWLNPLGC